MFGAMAYNTVRIMTMMMMVMTTHDYAEAHVRMKSSFSKDNELEMNAKIGQVLGHNVKFISMYVCDV